MYEYISLYTVDLPKKPIAYITRSQKETSVGCATHPHDNSADDDIACTMAYRCDEPIFLKRSLLLNRFEHIQQNGISILD